MQVHRTLVKNVVDASVSATLKVLAGTKYRRPVGNRSPVRWLTSLAVLLALSAQGAYANGSPILEGWGERYIKGVGLFASYTEEYYALYEDRQDRKLTLRAYEQPSLTKPTKEWLVDKVLPRLEGFLGVGGDDPWDLWVAVTDLDGKSSEEIKLRFVERNSFFSKETKHKNGDFHTAYEWGDILPDGDDDRRR